MQKLSELLDSICHSEEDRIKVFQKLASLKEQGLLNITQVEDNDGGKDRIEVTLKDSALVPEASSFH